MDTVNKSREENQMGKQDEREVEAFSSVVLVSFHQSWGGQIGHL